MSFFYPHGAEDIQHVYSEQVVPAASYGFGWDGVKLNMGNTDVF